MAMRRVGVFGVDTAPELREIAERRKLDQHEDENGDAGNGKHAGEAPFAARARYEPDRGKRERQEQRADIFRSGGEAGIGTDEERAQRRRVLQELDQRRKPEDQEGREENVLLPS